MVQGLKSQSKQNLGSVGQFIYKNKLFILLSVVPGTDLEATWAAICKMDVDEGIVQFSILTNSYTYRQILCITLHH